jgi:hypothetical protein
MANLQIPVSVATPESKKTFASATSTNSNFSSVKTLPMIPALHGTLPRNIHSSSVDKPYKKPSPNFKTVGTGERATIICTIPLAVKYRKLAPIEYKAIVNKHKGLIHIGKFYSEAPPYEHNILWIKTAANARKLGELRSDDDNSDISFAAVGHHFVDSIGLFEKYHTVELYKAFEVKITQDAKDEMCIGMIAIRLKSPQGMTEKGQIMKLEQLAQTAIYTQAFLDITPTDLPKCVSAFSFEINLSITLTSSSSRLATESKRNGTTGKITSDSGGSWNFRPDSQGRQLPKSLERWIDQGERLGLLTYLSSSVKVDVSFQCFSSRSQSKGQKKQNEPIINFARTSIFTNHKHGNEHFKVVQLNGLTNAIESKATQTNVIVNYKHLIAVVARTVRLPIRSPTAPTATGMRHNSSLTAQQVPLDAKLVFSYSLSTLP